MASGFLVLATVVGVIWFASVGVTRFSEYVVDEDEKVYGHSRFVKYPVAEKEYDEFH